MIEQFTPEQLAQIRKELGMMNKNRQKDSLLHAQYARLDQVFPRRDYQLVGLYNWPELRQALTVLCDHTVNNYVAKQTHRDCNPRLARNNTVPAELTDRYKAVADEIIDVLERHKVELDVEQMKERLKEAKGRFEWQEVDAQ